MTRKKQTYVSGQCTHRRTEANYMSVLIDAVSLDDWRAVVTATVAAAKAGDASARAWLGQYLVGRPGLTAPPPLTVVVQQLSGRDPIVDELANRQINRLQFPNPFEDEALEFTVRETIREELRRQDQWASEQPATTEQCGSADDFGKN